MRVTFNTQFNNGIYDLEAAATRLAEWQRQVSSQKRIDAPSDDPSAAAAVILENSQMATLDQYEETTDSVEARLKVADTFLSDLITNLTHAQTTAAAGRSTILKAEQREALALEMRSVRDAILQDFNVQYRGQYLFSGTASLTAPFAKDGAGVVQPYAGNDSVQRLDIDRNRTVPVTLDGGAVAGNLFDALDSLATAIESGDGAQMDAGIADLNAAFRRATTAQSSVGATLSDLDANRIRLDSERRASLERRSSLEDTNLAEAASRMQAADTAYRAALAAVSTNARLSLMDYLR
ncbi:MAG: flagellar hook-associated protein FlgL [Vicinamibacterales bacterium]